ncbi:hypothetical protein EC96154_A0133 [Escherichia coli 96.154]|nr:hypothetical protein EC96154_A0133 [Escherichia coli 96.154]
MAQTVKRIYLYIIKKAIYFFTFHQSIVFKEKKTHFSGWNVA